MFFHSVLNPDSLTVIFHCSFELSHCYCNEYGQSGLERKSEKVINPEKVNTLKHSPVYKIAAGGYHTMAVSISGSLYGWGKNRSEFGITIKNHCDGDIFEHSFRLQSLKLFSNISLSQ